MTDPQSLEEAWENRTQHQPCVDEECPLCRAEDDAIRAGYLAVLEEAYEYDAKHNHRAVKAGCCRYHDLQRQIKELGA